MNGSLFDSLADGGMMSMLTRRMNRPGVCRDEITCTCRCLAARKGGYGQWPWSAS